MFAFYDAAQSCVLCEGLFSKNFLEAAKVVRASDDKSNMESGKQTPRKENKMEIITLSLALTYAAPLVIALAALRS